MRLSGMNEKPKLYPGKVFSSSYLSKFIANSITGFCIKWIYHLMPFFMLFTNIIIASTGNSDLSTCWPLKNDLNMGYKKGLKHWSQTL